MCLVYKVQILQAFSMDFGIQICNDHTCAIFKNQGATETKIGIRPNESRSVEIQGLEDNKYFL